MDSSSDHGPTPGLEMGHPYDFPSGRHGISDSGSLALSQEGVASLRRACPHQTSDE